MRVRTRTPLNLSIPAEPAGDDKGPETQAESAKPAAAATPEKPLVRARARMTPAAVTYRTTRRPSDTPAPGKEPAKPQASSNDRAQMRDAKTPEPTPPARPKTPSAVIEPVMQTPDAPPLPGSRDSLVLEGRGNPSSSKPYKPARFAYFMASLAAVVWAAGVSAFIIGYQGGFRAFDYTPFTSTILALLALAPIGLVFAMAYVARQGSRLAVETSRARALSEAMVAPAAHASGETADVVRLMRAEIEGATAAAGRARDELTQLKEALAAQTRELTQAAELASRTAKDLEQVLGAERDQMAKLTAGLEAQALGIVEAVERQTRTTAEVSDLAQAQLREAEAALTARAADLAAAAGEAQDAARLAADDLARQTIRLETAGTGVAEQIRSVEEGLSQQRAALVAAGYTLRTDQEDFSAQVETQRAQLAEALSQTQSASSELIEASARGADALSSLVADAAAQASAFAELTEAERDAFHQRIAEGLERLTQLAAIAREDLANETNHALVTLTAAADEARKAADAAADAAQARIDNMGEAAFDAARRADEAFESRISAAKRLFDESAALVDAAGERARERLDAKLGEVRNSVTDLESVLAEIDERAARLPADTKERVEEIRASVEQGLEAMAASARKAAEDTQSVDAAFQDRVKRNYDMLSEAVKLMGLVSGGSPQPRPRPEPEAGWRRDAVPEPRNGIPELEPTSTAPADVGLRPRLKLTPAEPDVREVPAPAARGREGWTWRDLLGSMEGNTDVIEPVEDDDLADRMIEEIHRLGVDPNALLPRSRVEAAAEAHQVGAPDTAREIVRRVAPAAARRISRAVLTDRNMREQADRFLAGYEAKLNEAVRRDPEGFMTMALLASESGRAFLLMDAAIGDLG